MRTLLALAVVLVAAGCGTTTPVPTEARASADGLAAYLADRGADVSVAAPGIGVAPVDGAELTVLQVGRAVSGRIAVRPRDRDYRTAADLGRPGTIPWPPARHTGPPLLLVYRFDGPADLGALRDALGVQSRGGGLVAYTDGSLAVVTDRGAVGLARLLTRAFGDPRSL